MKGLARSEGNGYKDNICVRHKIDRIDDTKITLKLPLSLLDDGYATPLLTPKKSIKTIL